MTGSNPFPGRCRPAGKRAEGAMPSPDLPQQAAELLRSASRQLLSAGQPMHSASQPPSGASQPPSGASQPPSGASQPTERGQPATERGQPATERGQPAAERGQPATERGGYASAGDAGPAGPAGRDSGHRVLGSQRDPVAGRGTRSLRRDPPGPGRAGRDRAQLRGRPGDRGPGHREAGLHAGHPRRRPLARVQRGRAGPRRALLDHPGPPVRGRGGHAFPVRGAAGTAGPDWPAGRYR